MARSRARLAVVSANAKDPERPTKLRLWLRRRKKLLRPVGIGAAIAGALGVCVVFVMALDPAGRLRFITENFAVIARDTAGLAVQEVIVEGRRNTPMELLRSALGVSRGDPILAFSPEATKARLETIAWVQNADIERRLPGTIIIRLTERSPFAIWQNNNRFAIVDRDGREVASERLDAFGPLPLVVGAGANTGAAALIDKLHESPELMARIQALVRVSQRRWNLRLYNGADVLLPEGQEAAAITRLQELHKQNALLDRPLAAIDMRLPDRLVLRQQPPRDPPPAATPARGNGRG